MADPNDPLRLRIQKALTAELEQVLDDKDRPLTGKVFRGRDHFGNSDPLPML